MDHRLVTLGLLLFFQGLPWLTLQDATFSLESNDVAFNMSDLLRSDTEQRLDKQSNASSVETSADDSSGAASGSLATFEANNNQTEETTWEEVNTTVTHRPLITTAARELNNSKSDQVDLTQGEALNSSVVNQNSTESSQNSTEMSQNATLSPGNSSAHLDFDNSTGPLDVSNATQTLPTSAPEVNVTKSVLPKPENTTELPKNTSLNDPAVETTAAPATTRAMTPGLFTTASAVQTTAGILKSSVAQKASNLTDKNAAAGSSSERGLDSKGKRQGAWGALLGIGVAVALVGFVAYVILKKRHQTGFTHRKLVEEFPSDPVLRLDNNEPLDLNFGGGAYYNPGLQGDHIQMSNFPQRKRN
ncbi:mucin-15 [Synchiropus splendidus]|uniref:mucin-15 n=1 Tax=Synchiropus splendidus TaxID=270530 RepID=UPI00237E3559|nr:mucin-15 [Synchiropus splendidus]